MHPSAQRQALRDLVEPTLARLGYDLVAVEIIGGRRRTLRLSIDRDGGIGADDCAKASVRLGPVLDDADPFRGAWQLEVSSPGIERPVQRHEDFRRFVGFRFRIRMEEGLPRRRYTGRVVRVTPDDVHVLVDAGEHVLPFESIDAAWLDLDLDTYEQLSQGLPPVPPEGEDAVAPDAANPESGGTEPSGSEEER